MNTVLSDLVAGVLLLAVTAYSTAGGVDYGAGIWALLAGGGRAGREARDLINFAMAPVWEVNNVWLVLALVVAWTGFPQLFEAVFLSLYPLLALALLGLILRGAFFAFRHVAEGERERDLTDLVFSISSLLAPFFFAATLGAIASGQVHRNGPATTIWQACVNPTSVSFGLVSLTATAFSGASFLVAAARRQHDALLERQFRVRGVLAGLALIVCATGALGAIGWQVPSLLRSMFSFPAVYFSALAILLTPIVAFSLWRGFFFYVRALTVAAVGSLVLAWAFAQSPYLLPGQLTITAAAAPTGSLVLLLVVALVLVVVIGPAMALLYYLDQQSLLKPPEAT